jgi:hypothetical protein
MKHRHPLQRITISIDIPDEPGNDTTAITALQDILNHLEHAAIYPLTIRLEIQPAPTP